MSDRAKDILASAIAGIVTGILVTIVGGPPWAAMGFAYLTYLLVRN